MKTEAYIIIKNCSKEELKTMLNDWLVMYAAGLKSKMIFEIAETNPNNCILKVDKGIDDTKFFYMVNYFSYPFNFNRTFEVEGYATATKHKKLLGKNIYVFISGQDDEHDNVWITTEEGETYKFDFEGKLKKLSAENKYNTWNTAGLSITYEQINVDKKALLDEAKRREEEKSRRRTAKRFKVISTLLFVSIPSAYLINRYFPYIDNRLLVYFSSFVIAGWFWQDYKIFGNTGRTFISVLLALLNFTCIINIPDRPVVIQDLFVVLLSLPLSSIIVMLVLNRFLGARVGKIQDSWWDRLFFLALCVVSILISAFVFSPVLKFFNIIVL